VLVVRERGELPEQALGSIGFIRPGLLCDVGAQRLDLGDRDLVRRTGPLHRSGVGYQKVVRAKRPRRECADFSGV
jgi:hypothetical protein